MVNFYYDPFSYILDTEYTGQRNSSNGTGILEHSRVQPTVFSNYIPYGNSCHQNVPCQQTYFNTYQNSYRHPQHILTQFPSSQSSFPNYQQPHYQPYQPPLPVQKKRTVFTVDQLTLLEEAFQKNDKITPEEMRTLMKQTGLSNAQIRTWFNNRRQRKKQENGRKLIIQSVKDKFSF